MEHPPRNLDLTCFSWVKLILKTDINHHAKYLALYLSTYMNLNQDMAFPSLKRIERETGLGHATVLKYLKLLESEGWLNKESGSSTESNRYWVDIPEGVGRELTYVASRERVGRESTSNNNRITNTTTTTTRRMKKPTLEEVTNFVTSKKYTFNPEQFFNYYESNGWRVGKNPMKSWQAACTTWQTKEKKNGQSRQNTGRTENPRRLSPLERVNAAAARRQAERAGQAPGPVAGNVYDME